MYIILAKYVFVYNELHYKVTEYYQLPFCLVNDACSVVCMYTSAEATPDVNIIQFVQR